MPEKASASFQLPAGEAEPSGQLAAHSPDAQRRGIEAFIRISRLAGAIILGLYGLLYLQTGAWQMLVVAGGMAIAMSCLVPAYKLARRGNLNAAGYWLVFGVTLAYSASELGWTGATGYIFGGGLLLIFLAGSIVLPRRWGAWLSVAGLFAAYIWLVNRFEPLPRYDATQSAVLRLYLPGVTALLAVGLLWQLIRAYQGISTIRARLLVAFVLLVLVSATVVSAVSVIGSLEGGQRQVINQLKSVVALKAARVEAWRQSLELNLAIELSREPVAQRMKVLSQASPDTADFQAAYTSQSNRFQQTVKLRQDFEDLFLMDRQGRVLLSTDATQEGKIYSNQVFFQEGLKGSFITPPLYDVSLDRTSVLVARPVVDEQKQVLGVLAGRASMAILSADMLERAGLGETGETYLVGSNHLMLTESRFAKQEGGRIYVRSQGINAAIENQADGSGLYNGYRGVPVVGVYQWLPELQVALVAEQDQAEAFQAIYATLGINVGVTIAALLIAMGASLLVTRSIANPLASLTKAATQITAGDLTLVAPVKRKDEVGVLVRAFNSMTAQLRDLIGSLEQRVAERTAELTQRSEELEKINVELEATTRQAERRAGQLAASAQVARAVSQVRDLEQLLPDVTRLISQAFGYYHVGVFTVDELGRFAVLRATNSEGGQRLLARGHKLSIGQQGIVGYVTGAGRPRIALNVGADAVHFDNPDLPETRSEMALPLRVGEQTFGALDVQSTREAAFSEEDVAVLSTLADQIAIAIENVRLFGQTQTALQAAEATTNRYLRQEWGKLISTRPITGHEYRISGVPSVGNASLPEIEQAIRQGKAVVAKGDGDSPVRTALAVPIKLRDQVVGVIDLHETDIERNWTEDDIAILTAVADQAGLALENVRLIEETERFAQRERTINEINSRVRQTIDLDAILKTAVNELGQSLKAARVVARVGVSPGDSETAPVGNGRGDDHA